MFKNNCKRDRRKLNFVALSAVTQLLIISISVLSIPWIDKAKGETLVFLSDFESGFSEWRTELCCSYSAQIVNSPVRAGNQAIMFTLKQDDPLIANSKRAELKLGGVPANSEQWYSFSFFLPSNYQQDPSGETIAQWHDLPDRDLGEGFKIPPLSLSTRDGRLYINRRWDSKPLTEDSRSNPEGSEEIDLGLYQIDRWTDLVFHVKWSYASDGLLEVWQDGKLVVRKIGANSYNDRRGPYLKIGMYKGDWKHPGRSILDQRSIYFDEVRVGDANASYKDVAPRK